MLLKLGLWSQELAGKDLPAKYRHLLFSDFIDVHPICIMRSPHLIEHHDDLTEWTNGHEQSEYTIFDHQDILPRSRDNHFCLRRKFGTGPC